MIHIPYSPLSPTSLPQFSRYLPLSAVAFITMYVGCLNPTLLRTPSQSVRPHFARSHFDCSRRSIALIRARADLNQQPQRLGGWISQKYPSRASESVPSGQGGRGRGGRGGGRGARKVSGKPASNDKRVVKAIREVLPAKGGDGLLRYLEENELMLTGGTVGSFFQACKRLGHSVEISERCWLGPVTRALQTANSTPRDLSQALQGLSVLRGWSEEGKSAIAGVLARKIQVTDGKWCIRDICIAFGGVRVLRDTSETRRVVKELSERLVETPDSIDGRAVGTILLGIQNLGESPEVERLFQSLQASIQANRPSLNHQEVGNALYGLRSISEISEDLENLLESLGELLEDFHGELTSQEIGNAFYGLKGFSNMTPGVERVLSSLNNFLLSTGKPLSAQAISNSLYGLQDLLGGTRPLHPLLTQTLNQFSKAIEECTDTFTPQAIANSLYALRLAENATDVVDPILMALAEKLRKSTDREEFSGQGFGMSLYALHRLENSNGLRAVVRAVAERVIPRVKGRIRPQALANALYGLKNLQPSPESNEILSEISEKILPKVNGKVAPREFAMSLFGLRDFAYTYQGGRIITYLAAKADEGLAWPHICSLQEISNALYGLGRAREFEGSPWNPGERPSGISESLRKLLELLGRELERFCDSEDYMSVKELSMSLNGLQSHGDSPEIRRILNQLSIQAQKLRSKGSEQFDFQAVGNSLIGLKNMAISKELNGLLDSLLPLIQNAKWTESSQPQAIANALYGLQGLPLNRFTLLVLQKLTPHLPPPPSPPSQSHPPPPPEYPSFSGYPPKPNEFTPQHVANALFGLQNLCETPMENLRDSSESRDLKSGVVGEVIDRLGEWVGAKEGDVSWRLGSLQLGQSIFGLLTHRSHPLFPVLIKKALSLQPPRGIPSDYNLQESPEDLQESLDALMELKSSRISEESQVFREVSEDLQGIESLVQSLVLAGNPPREGSYVMGLYRYTAEKLTGKPRNHLESEIQRMFANKSVIMGSKLLSNVFVDGFELDLFEPELKLNIEIDGDVHKRKDPYRERLRDTYLFGNHGIYTVRIPAGAGRSAQSIANEIVCEIRRYEDARASGAGPEGSSSPKSTSAAKLGR
ncbi:hypothetical protein AAMO2058_001028500 [Amorphochlora amoebiformis]